MLELGHPGPRTEGVIFDAPNQGNNFPYANDYCALKKKYRLFAERVTYGLGIR